MIWPWGLHFDRDGTRAGDVLPDDLVQRRVFCVIGGDRQMRGVEIHRNHFRIPDSIALRLIDGAFLEGRSAIAGQEERGDGATQYHKQQAGDGEVPGGPGPKDILQCSDWGQA